MKAEEKFPKLTAWRKSQAKHNYKSTEPFRIEVEELLAHWDETQWRPIAEAPRDGTDILIGGIGVETLPARKFAEGDRARWITRNYCDFNKYTHWMPLPKGPTKGPQ